MYNTMEQFAQQQALKTFLRVLKGAASHIKLQLNIIVLIVALCWNTLLELFKLL